MATISELENALIKADKAGDADAVRILSAEIKSVRKGAEPKPEFKAGATDYARAAGQGFTFGFGDELAALFRSVGSETYEEALADERAALDKFRKEDPVAAYGLEIAGSIPSSLLGVGLLGRGAQAASKAAPILSKVPKAVSGPVSTGIASGLSQGAIYGAGTATEGERLEGAIGGGIVGGATGGVLGAALPKVSEGAKALLKEKVPLTLGQARGGILGTAEEIAQYIPIAGRSISTARNRALEKSGRAPINQVLGIIDGKPLPKGATGTEAVSHMKSQVKDAYEKVKPKLSLKSPQKDILPDVKKSIKPAFTGKTTEAQAVAKKYIDSDIIPQLDKKILQGEEWFQIDKNLNNKISSLKTSASSTDADRNAAKILESIQLTFRKSSKKKNPEAVAQYEVIDSAYGLSKAISAASRTAGAREARGAFAPNELLAQLSRQKGRFESGGALGQEQALQALETLGKRAPRGGRPIAEILAGTGLGAGGLATGLLGPMGAAIATVPAAYSRLGVPLTRGALGGAMDLTRSTAPRFAGGAAGEYVTEPVMGLLGQE